MPGKNMTRSPDRADGPAQVELARITEVNFREYSVDVETVFTHKPLADIPIGAMYAHQAHGGGVYFMPEIGSYCYVFSSADDTQFAFGWVVNPETRVNPALDENGNVDLTEGDQGPSFAGRRPLMEPGDIMLTTRDGNLVSVKRGGIVQIAATGLAQRMYIPLENLIRDVFQRYEARSPLGEIIWGHASLAEEANVEDTGVLIQGSWREKAQDTDFAVEVRIGQLDETLLDPEIDSEHFFLEGKEADGFIGAPIPVLATNVGVFSFTVTERDLGTVVYKMQLSRDGDLFVLSKANIHVETETFFLKIGDAGKVEFGDDNLIELLSASNTLRAVVQQIVLDQLANLSVVAGTAQLALGGVTINLAGGNATVEGAINIGVAGGLPVVVDRGALLRVVKEHKHPFDVPGQGRLKTLESEELIGVEAAVAASLKAT